MALCALETPGSFPAVTLPSPGCDSHSQSKMTYYHITSQSAGRQKKGRRCTSLFFRDTSQKLCSLLSLTYTWSTLSHMATSHCKVNWEMQFLSQAPMQPAGNLESPLYLWFPVVLIRMHLWKFSSDLCCLGFSKLLSSKNLHLFPNFGTFHLLFLQGFLAHSFPPGTPIACIFDLL